MTMVRLALGALIAALLCVSAWAKPYDVSGTVVYVDDGDSLVLLLEGNRQMKIRLSSIDAPESAHTKKVVGRIGQPYSKNAGQFLAGMVKGRHIDAHCFERDVHGRDVCELFINGTSVSREMVKEGWAWANTSARGRYLRDKTLPELQRLARGKALGLWASDNPVAPWEWRDLCWKQGVCPQ